MLTVTRQQLSHCIGVAPPPTNTGRAHVLPLVSVAPAVEQDRLLSVQNNSPSVLSALVQVMAGCYKRLSLW